jgi:hypothetical protein
MPNIEWHVNEDNREETIAVTTSTSTRRWRVSLIALMIVLGASLGAMYASVKEPAPRPASTPSVTSLPVPAPPSLIETIDREAQALADGDFETVLSLQDQPDDVWFEKQAINFHTWGRPPYDQSPLYYFIGLQPDPLPRDHIALDTLQYRNGAYFRETRFYQLINNQWKRTAPDPSFWSGQHKVEVTQHFTLTYPIEDGELIPILLGQLETAYDRVCVDLNCPAGLTFSFSFSPMREPSSIDTINLPSLRIEGMYTSINWLPRSDVQQPPSHGAANLLTSDLIYRLSGIRDRSPADDHGWFLIEAVMMWEFNRASGEPDMLKLFSPQELSRDAPLIKLESLWTLKNESPDPYQVARSVIFFIEAKYGVEGVAKFLKATGPAKLWTQVIENSLGVNEIQFEQQWKDWLKQFYNQGN